MKKIALLFSVVLLIALFVAQVQPILACGPSFTVPVFGFESRPDLELESYANGRIGIIQPEYNWSFLFAAYRHFNGAPFSKAEQKDLVKIWNAELYREDDKEIDTNAAVKTWLAARKKVFPDEPAPEIYTEHSYGYGFFPNCTANAFETAAKTLENRAQQHGATNENVKNWVRGQDAVFRFCSDSEKAVYPEPTMNAPEWLAKDREYQFMAAKFYAAKFDEARKGFEEIAADNKSVWSATADYLVARTLIRQASLLDDEDPQKLAEKRRPFYEQAEARLQTIMTNPNRREFHQAANSLLNLVKYRLRPAERIHELAAILTQPGENPNLRQDLIDYTWLLERQNEIAEAAAEKAANEAAKKAGKEYPSDYKVAASDYPSIIREDDLTDWILTFQSIDADAFSHSLKKWRETNSAAWFVAAIAKAKKDSAEVSGLIAEAEKIEKTHPAFAFAAFHQNRLLIETGRRAEAKRKLDFLLTNKMTVFPISTRNAFASQRMMLAENLDEFLTFAQRKAVAFASDGSPGDIQEFSEETLKDWDYGKKIAAWRDRTMFDEDAARVFNEQMSLAILKQAVTSPRLPDYLKRNIVIAAWTRAILLNNEAAAIELAPHLTRLAPEFQTVFGQYTSAKTAAERQNAATYILLKFPALRPFVETGYGRLEDVAVIDSYRDNWWCAPSEFTYNNAGEKVELTALPAPPFLTEANVSAARREREQLKKLGGGSTYLARRAVEFATKSPNDARVPESLHLAVRSTRYGCQDCDTGKFSKQAHDILKKRFPRSEWTKKTPYWFKDESCDQQ